MLNFWRLKLVMIKDGAKLHPEAKYLNLIKQFDHIQTVNDTHCIAEVKSRGVFTFWHFSKGSALPRSDTIIVETELGVEEKPNNRLPNEIEPNDQFFALYDSENDYFYLSNSKKQNYCLTLFNGKTEEDGITWQFLKIYKTPEQFVQSISSIKHLKLVSEKDLFNQQDYEFPLVSQLSQPKSYELTVEFELNSMPQRCLQKLKELVGMVNVGRYQSLVCVGVGDKGIERVFNAEVIMDRIPVSVDKDDQSGMYNPDDVMNKAIDSIESFENA